MGLNELRNSINAKFGSVILPAKRGIRYMPRFSSGILNLDVDLGGGWPENKVVEIYGPESSGKTFLLYKAIAVITNRDKDNKVLLIDEEGSYDEEWGVACGINQDNLDICRSDYAEQALDIMEVAVQSGEYALVAIDSIAALIPKAELEESTEDWKMGLLARLLGKACRKAFKGLTICTKNNKKCTIFFINQLRDKIGVVWGNPEFTPGGRAIKFAASIRIDIRKEEMLQTSGNIIYGQTSKYAIVKNKTAPPLRKGSFSYHVDGSFKGSILNLKALIEYGVKIGSVDKKTSWYSGDWLYGNRVQGSANVEQVLANYSNDDLNCFVKDIQDELLCGNKLEFKFED